MKHYYAPIFICSGINNRLCVGVALFNDDTCIAVEWDDRKLKRAIKFYEFPESVSTSTFRFKFNPKKSITRTYWDNYLVSHSNGMMQFGKSNMVSLTEEKKDTDKFIKVIIG